MAYSLIRQKVFRNSEAAELTSRTASYQAVSDTPSRNCWCCNIWRINTHKQPASLCEKYTNYKFSNIFLPSPRDSLEQQEASDSCKKFSVELNECRQPENKFSQERNRKKCVDQKESEGSDKKHKQQSNNRLKLHANPPPAAKLLLHFLKKYFT